MQRRLVRISLAFADGQPGDEILPESFQPRVERVDDRLATRFAVLDRKHFEAGLGESVESGRLLEQQRQADDPPAGTA